MAWVRHKMVIVKNRKVACNPKNKCRKYDAPPMAGLGMSDVLMDISYNVGSRGRIRTSDPMINNHPLCQLSYTRTLIYIVSCV